MRRFAAVVAITAMLCAGCAAPAPAPLPTGEDLSFPVPYAASVVWSPGGKLAVIEGSEGAGFHVLDVAAKSLTPLPDFEAKDPAVFWTETEVAWMRDGRLQLRDLANGQTRTLHDFGQPVTQLLRPGDTHYVVLRPDHSIVAGALNSTAEKVLIERGYLVGRLADGRYLATEGVNPRGPLWLISPTGVQQLLSQTPVSFVQIAADGRRALWLTGDAGKPPVVYDEEYYSDPPLTDLWVWDGAKPPARTPLGKAYSARASFSPDGKRIALALSEGFAGTDTTGIPGHLGVVVGGKVRKLATFTGGADLEMWLGNTAFKFTENNRRVTGGPSPTTLMHIDGKQEDLSAGSWYSAYRETQIPDTRPLGRLAVHVEESGTTVHWADSDQTARINLNPTDLPGRPLYAPPTAPYLPFVGPDQLWLKRLYPDKK